MNRIVAATLSRHGPFPGRLEPERMVAYTAATGDDTPSVLAGEAVPAVFPVVLVFEAQEAANADLPEAAWRQAHGGVHGEHDIVVHRSLIQGESLETWSQISAVRTVRAGTLVVLHIQQADADGQVVVEQWWTTVLLGLHTMADVGSPPADHRFPDWARSHRVGSAIYHIDEHAAHRYAEVSGDWSAHHFDMAAAPASGSDFLFAHGLCTMAICTHVRSRLWVSTIPGGCRELRCGSRRPHRWELTSP